MITSHDGMLLGHQAENHARRPPAALPQHRTADPAILYFGTPVVLISSVNEDGSYNLAPMSSAWWLGRHCMLGLAAVSQTPQNLIRTRECVLNLPSDTMVAAVNRLARTTGSDPVPEIKVRRGYRHVRDKFGLAGLTPIPSKAVAAPRVQECPVQLEAGVESVHPLAEHDPRQRGRALAIDVRIVRVHLAGSILMDGDPDRIDPDKWRPLIMSFQQFYGLAPDRLHSSELAKIPESAYRL
ncbi:MAG TPA: flavin reductase family protein [Xanthobacteraceae bacterium]|nr:flavin reductase family protein [Xanthobacteraceae bacterium]